MLLAAVANPGFAAAVGKAAAVAAVPESARDRNRA